MIVDIVNVRIKDILLNQKVYFLFLSFYAVHSIEFGQQRVWLLADVLEVGREYLAEEDGLGAGHGLDDEL